MLYMKCQGYFYAAIVIWDFSKLIDQEMGFSQSLQCSVILLINSFIQQQSGICLGLAYNACHTFYNH